MQIQYTGHGIDVTSSLKTFTQEKFDRVLQHFDKITSIHVIFNVEKLDHTAEATIVVTKAELHASATCEDMYKAVDELIHKLERQLIKHKEKMSDHRE